MKYSGFGIYSHKLKQLIKMTSHKINEQLNQGCKEALAAFEKINDNKFADFTSKLEYVIGSYEFDKNPVGLHEFGKKALDTLTDYKKDNPRKVAKKSIEKISKAIERFEKA